MADETGTRRQPGRYEENQDLRNPENVVIGFKDNLHHYKDITVGMTDNPPVRQDENQDLRRPENVVMGFKDNVHHYKYITLEPRERERKAA
jgi:hypothetical protein